MLELLLPLCPFEDYTALARISMGKGHTFLSVLHFVTMNGAGFTLCLQVPWFEKAIDFDVRAKPRNIASLTGTKGMPQSRPSITLLIFLT